jgi:hypothetical protein
MLKFRIRNYLHASWSWSNLAVEKLFLVGLGPLVQPPCIASLCLAPLYVVNNRVELLFRWILTYTKCTVVQIAHVANSTSNNTCNTYSYFTSSFIFCLLENLDYYYISNFIYILGWPHTNLLALVVHYQLMSYHYHLAIWHILPLFIHV